MVKRTFLLGLGIAFMLPAGSAQFDTEAVRPRLRRLQLPAIKEITIEENGAKAPAAQDSPEQCEAFKLGISDVREYLARAAEVQSHDYFHMLDWSPCYASGRLVFKSGLTGRWAIQQLRAGSLSLSDGRSLYLYCPTCKASAFAGP